VRLRVQPSASRDAIVGWQAGALRVRVSAPPVEGEANRAVIALLARTLGIRPRAVRVVHGDRARDKLVRIDGLSQTVIEARLGRADDRGIENVEP
jgi:uncharacterized protein